MRMPPIVDFTTETAKDREWDNIAAIHRCLGFSTILLKLVVVSLVAFRSKSFCRGQGEATTWSYGHSKMGDLKLLHPRFKEV